MGNRKVLVTGHGGFLGTAIAKKLISQGFEVTGLARGSYPHLSHLGVQSVQGSLTDPAAVHRAVEGCAAIIHTAAQAGVWGSWDSYHSVNTLGTQHLLDAATRHGVEAMVFTSSPSVTFDAANQSGIDESTPYPQKWLCHYPHTKALAEQAVLQAAGLGAIRACSLRPHLIWGEGDPHLMPRVVQRTLAGRLRRVGSGTNLIDIVHVDNAADAHVLALEKLLSGDKQVNGEAFFITDGQPQGCWDWISRILGAAGVAIPRGHIAYRTAYSIGAMLEGLYALRRAKAEPPMTRFVAAQLALDHYFSIDKARKLLGYSPSIDIDAKLAACSPWLRSLASDFHVAEV